MGAELTGSVDVTRQSSNAVGVQIAGVNVVPTVGRRTQKARAAIRFEVICNNAGTLEAGGSVKIFEVAVVPTI